GLTPSHPTPNPHPRPTAASVPPSSCVTPPAPASILFLSCFFTFDLEQTRAMKIFGKRKASVAGRPSSVRGTNSGDDGSGAASTKTSVEEVPSYFSAAQPHVDSGASKKRRKSKDGSNAQPEGDDIAVLLAMDPTMLTSKQRRMVRRHKEREGNATTAGKVEGAETKSGGDGKDSTLDEAATSMSTQTDEQKTTSADSGIGDILAKLEGLNSKERRKYLRQLRSSTEGAIDESVIAAAEEQARKIAERNKKDDTNVGSKTSDGVTHEHVKEKKANTDQRKDAQDSIAKAKPNRRGRRKGPVNLDDLSPEERERREEQRRMQKEASERREAGLVDPNRHPLNSERRRANRRKPSKAALMAQARKEQMAERGQFNANGYHIRKGKGNTEG
ncbi:hypothetical protein ACHAWF_003419, partial [Thalassiosira exigua]